MPTDRGLERLAGDAAVCRAGLADLREKLSEVARIIDELRDDLRRRSTAPSEDVTPEEPRRQGEAKA